MSLPGGDDFGDRPIDLHLNALTAMGAGFEIVPRRRSRRRRHRRPPGRHPGGPRVPEPHRHRQPAHGRGAGQGHDGHRERGPGARGHRPGRPSCVPWGPDPGAGTSRIEVEGVDELRPATHAVVPDRVVAATFLAAAGMTGGDVTIADARPDHMEMLLRKVNQMGVVTTMGPDGLRATADRPAGGGGRGHAALSGRGHRLQPAAGGHADGGRRGGHRHREPLLRSFPLRRGAAPDGCRHQDRGAPRRRAGCRTACPAPACAPRTSGPGRPWCWPAWWPRARPSVTDAHHIDRGYEDLVGALCSLGAKVTGYMNRRLAD